MFPFITVCKIYTFDELPGVLKQIKEDNFKEEEVRLWFKKHTWNRTRVVSFLSHRNISENGIEVSGPKAGHPCVFPFYYPDCSLVDKPPECKSNAKIKRTLYNNFADNEDTLWCSTRNYWNNSYIMGEYKCCSRNCNTEGDSPNLASSDFENYWEDGLYSLDMYGSGHCHTYNPGFSSLAGFKGQFYILFGRPFFYTLYALYLIRKYSNFIHLRQ